MNDNLHLAGYPLPSAASVAAWEKEARCGSSAAIRPVATGPAGETGRQTRPQLSNLCQDIDGQDHCARGGSVSSVPRKLSANQSELPQSAQAN